MADSNGIAKWQVYTLMGLMLFFGSTNTIIQKYQNELETEDEHRVKIKYVHPFFQIFWMFIGEFWWLGIYKIVEWRANSKYGGADNNPDIIKAKGRGLNTEINEFLIAIPATFDCIGSSLMFIALTIIAASIYQMMRGFLIFIVASFSIVFLNRKLYRHHWTSLALIFLGLVLVGLSNILYPQNQDTQYNIPTYEIILGISLILIAQVFSGSQFVIEEKLFSGYYLHPLKIVGWEGLWGVLITAILLIIFQFIKWSSEAICPHGTLEDTSGALREWSQNSGLWITTILFIISIASYNIIGVTITKYVSAASRTTLDSARTAVIWGFFVISPGPGHEKFVWLELIGFLMLLFGTFVFNEVIILPCFGFNKYTKDALEANPNSEGAYQDISLETDQNNIEKNTLI